MAIDFIVQTDDGVSGANSYASVSYADDYHELRGSTTWSGTTAQKQAALVLSSDYIDSKYGTLFKGERTSTSGLAFPRSYAYDSNCTTISGVPEEIRKATVEYAVLNIEGTLYPEATEAGLTGFSRSVGSISESKSFSSGGASLYSSHPKADRYVVGFLNITRSGRA